MNAHSSITKAVGFGALALALFCACATSISAGSDAPIVETGPPALDSNDAGAVVQTDAEPAQCVSYECPAPYATCPGVSGLCTTNLSTSFDHCGACDTPCPLIPIAQRGVLNIEFVCSEGQCKELCKASHADCNGIVDDGCEVNLDADPSNCGTCGAACPAGSICWDGACGCPSGYTQCGHTCVKLDEDDFNCGACGNACTEPDVSDTGPGGWPCSGGNYPPGTQFNCQKKQCGMHCAPGFANCNADLCSDGCEINIAEDPRNCGACGNKCAPGQACLSGRCICDPDKTRCDSECVDLQTDSDNCGACGYRCPGKADFNEHRGGPVCVLGRCSYSCAPGYADCDHRIDNGCEVDLMVDPLNCGSCGTQCDQRGGQPCAAGRCLTKPCDDRGVH
jgi:hypothetical protein